MLVFKPVQADLTVLSDATPFPIKRPFPKQVGHDGHPIKPGDVLRGEALFEIGLHGSEMMPPCNFKGFGLLCSDVVLGALNAGMAEQKLGCPQVAGLLIDMGWEGSAQGVQPIETGIEACFFEPRFEQPPELAFAEMVVGPSGPLSGEEPVV